MVQDAVVRRVEIIGEAVRQLPQDGAMKFSSLLLMGIILVLGGAFLLVLSLLPLLPGTPLSPFLAHLGSVMIGAGAVEMLFHVYAARQWIQGFSQEVRTIFDMPITRFYANRGRLPTVIDEFSHVAELWAAWATGTTLSFGTAEQFFPSGRPGRALLIKPSNSLMPIVERFNVGASTIAADEVASQIRRSTKLLQECGVEVRWYDGIIGDSILIANPNREDGWIRVDVQIPSMPPYGRPSFLVEKPRSSALFGYVKRAYKLMWDSAEAPSELALSATPPSGPPLPSSSSPP